MATRARGRVTNFWEALPVGLRRAAVGGVRRLYVAKIKGEHSVHLMGEVVVGAAPWQAVRRGGGCDRVDCDSLPRLRLVSGSMATAALRAVRHSYSSGGQTRGCLRGQTVKQTHPASHEKQNTRCVRPYKTNAPRS